MKKNKSLIILFLLLFLIFVPGKGRAQAASLYFSPSSGSYAVDGNFSVNVLVSSTDQSVNAVSGTVSFPADKVSVVSISKTNSVLTLWVQEPSFTNDSGTANFEGVVLNPGFTGSSGKVISINFKVKASGAIPISFSAGSVLANDGNGTDILSSMGTANFSAVVGQAPPEIQEIPPEIGVPAAPQISSVTHPLSNKWYAIKDAQFSWLLPSDVTAVRLFINNSAQTIPTTSYIPPISSKGFTNLPDGIWYLHARLRNVGGWSATSHFKIQIDTVKPDSFDINEIQRPDLTDPKVKFNFNANDETSGVDHFEVQIDDKTAEIWNDDGSHIYQTVALGPGKHTLIAKAVDGAGNTLANSASFNIEALKSPTITEYSKELESGMAFVVKGETYPDAQVTVWLQNDGDTAFNQTVKSEPDGSFTFIADKKLANGIYKMWAIVTDGRGAQSYPTASLVFTVQQPMYLRIGSWTIGLLAVLIPIVALFALLVFIIWYGWHKFSLIRKKVKKEVVESEQTLRKVFGLLKDDIEKQVKLLEKAQSERQLTEEEQKVKQRLKEDMENAEAIIGKEIQDIDKELK